MQCSVFCTPYVSSHIEVHRYTQSCFANYKKATSPGQVENAEVRKPKYGNGITEVRRKAASWYLGPYSLTVWPCSQRVTLSLWYESRILGSRTVASVTITIHVTVSECGQTQTKTNSEWANHAGSMLLMFSWQWCRCKCCHSFSLRIFANGSTGFKTTPETLANI